MIGKFATESQKREFVQNYSGMWTREERGYVSDLKELVDSTILVELNGVDCEFNKRWRQKLQSSTEIYYRGVVDRYSADNGHLILSTCYLWR